MPKKTSTQFKTLKDVEALNDPQDFCNRQKIMLAARQVFYKEGLKGARMQEIADIAGINKALVHYYYRNKESLFAEILEEAFQNFLPQLKILSHPEIPVLERLNLFIDGYLDHLFQYRELCSFIFLELQHCPAVFKAHMERVKEAQSVQFEQDLNKEIKRGNIRNIDPLHLMINIWSMCAFPFISCNAIQVVHQLSDPDLDLFLKERKQVIKNFVGYAVVPDYQIKKNKIRKSAEKKVSSARKNSKSPRK